MPVLRTDFPEIAEPLRGKVRDVYDLGDRILIVTTDRVSAFDVVLPNGIPDKGKVLTRISLFWFERTSGIVPNHVLSTSTDDLPDSLKRHADILRGRMMIVKKARPLPIECIVRGYLSGSGWKDYRTNGSVCGISLPSGLRESDRLEEPIFTPSTKAEEGHDVNISFDETIPLVGRETAERVRDLSVRIYQEARDFAESRGILIADTKFEFGFVGDELTLIDEALTPDSSRFWPADDYEPGRAQRSFDKQFVRDYLETLDWDKTPPGPELPAEIVEKTRNKYLSALQQLAGVNL